MNLVDRSANLLSAVIRIIFGYASFVTKNPAISRISIDDFIYPIAKISLDLFA